MSNLIITKQLQNTAYTIAFYLCLVTILSILYVQACYFKQVAILVNEFKAEYIGEHTNTEYEFCRFNPFDQEVAIVSTGLTSSNTTFVAFVHVNVSFENKLSLTYIGHSSFNDLDIDKTLSKVRYSDCSNWRTSEFNFEKVE
jgi:hypothetical protein